MSYKAEMAAKAEHLLESKEYLLGPQVREALTWALEEIDDLGSEIENLQEQIDEGFEEVSESFEKDATRCLGILFKKVNPNLGSDYLGGWSADDALQEILYHINQLEEENLCNIKQLKEYAKP